MCNKCEHKYYCIYCVARDNMNLHSREIQRPKHLSGVILLRKCVQIQLCLTLCNPMDCNPPGSSVHGIYWSGLPFPTPGDFPDLGIEPASLLSPALGRWILYHWATWEAQRIHLRMQETWVWSLIQEDPTCHGTTNPMCHNYWAYIPYAMGLANVDAGRVSSNHLRVSDPRMNHQLTSICATSFSLTSSFLSSTSHL